MPPGIPAADITVTYLSVLRGGGMVSGGTLKALAGVDGVPKVGTDLLKLQVAYTDELVEQHPFARFAVSYRGAAAGYEFVVDLGMEYGATTVDITQPIGNMRLMTAEQNATIAQLIAQTQEAATVAKAATDAASAATERATTIADSLSASGLLYLGSDSDGAAMLATIPPRADIVYQTTNDWGLVGTMTAPVLIIGETK